MDEVVQSPVTSAGTKHLTAFERTLAFAALTSVIGIWIVAAILTPDTRGIGTHEQLGLAPCRLVTFFGIPCAFCGMTTAFAHLAHGNPIDALLTQPAAVLVAILTVPIAAISAWSTFAGTIPRVLIGLTASPRTFLAGLFILVAAWIYKIISYV